MKIITISRKQFEKLKLVDLDKNIMNTESKIYDYTYKGYRKILKYLYLREGTIFGSKLQTVQALNDNIENLPEEFCIPDYLVSYKNEAIGFTVPYVNGINLSTILNDYKMNPKEQIYYLKKIGFMLEQLKHIRMYSELNDIYINDLHASNFIVNPYNKSIKVIDLDSCKIGDNVAFPSKYLINTSLLELTPNKYIKNTSTQVGLSPIVANENSDLYCYTMMILNYLRGKDSSKITIEEFYNYLTYLEYIKINPNLIDCFNNLLTAKDNINPVYYLDTIDTTQFGRAKEKVYEVNKKKLIP